MTCLHDSRACHIRRARPRLNFSRALLCAQLFTRAIHRPTHSSTSRFRRMWLAGTASRHASLGSVSFNGCWQVVLAAPLTSLLAFKAPAVLGAAQSRNTMTSRTPITSPLLAASADASLAGLADATRCARACTGTHGHTRAFSSGRTAGYASDNGSPTLQTQLRQLMKKVHPDRWASSDHPEARSENERSFKLLQGYMDAAKVTHIHKCRHMTMRLPA